MATVLELRFPGRRYHATPWGHHVNEGQVEWPPSPWRLLRSLIATGFTRARWGLEGPPPAARRLIDRLAGVAPSYALPPIDLAHSRHYVTADAKKPLIFDTWARPQDEDAAIEVCWPVELDPNEREVLSQLVGLMGYLGRAESWVEVRLLDRSTQRYNCVPAERIPEGPEPGWERFRLLCAASAHAYMAWLGEVRARLDRELPLPVGKKPSAKLLKERERFMAPYPSDLFGALCAETGWLQACGWSTPPGSREVIYRRRLEPAPARAAPGLTRREDKVPMALLALSSPTRNRSALPGRFRVHPQGRLLHGALAAVIEQVGVEAAPILLGIHEGQPLNNGHGHAHLIHLDLDGDERLDHALVWAPDLLDAGALRALTGLQRTWQKQGPDLQLSLVAQGDRDEMRALGRRLFRAKDKGQSTIDRLLGPAEGATTWVSSTPFVAPRLTKKRGRDSIDGQVRLEAERRHLPPVEVERLPLDGRAHFLRYPLTGRGHAPPMAVVHALRLHFEEPVPGPIALGYGAHFGLGLFEPELLSG